MKKLLIYSILFLSFFFQEAVLGKAIKIATDENMWYPFSFNKNGKSKGLHIDIVTMALRNLNYSPTLKPLPWKRCLKYMETGKFDAVVGASYKTKRAQYMHFPPKAQSSKKSEYRITQVEYSIINHKDSPYEFKGDVKTLPLPIMTVLGYSIGDDLEAQKIKVSRNTSDINNFNQLVHRKKGTIVTLAGVAKLLEQQPRYKGKIKISKMPYKSKSYYFAFSKRSNFSEAERVKIWEEVKKIRENKDIMAKLYKQY